MKKWTEAKIEEINFVRTENGEAMTTPYDDYYTDGGDVYGVGGNS